MNDHTHTVYDQARQIQQDMRTLVGSLQAGAEDAERYITGEVKSRPYSTLAVAAGVGYVLGGGLSLRMTKLLIGVGTRLAMAVAARELSNMLKAPSIPNRTV